jgi:hypothetical protein
MAPEEAFSSSYQQARGRFLAAAQQAGLAVSSHIHPLRGSQGEQLAMDVVIDGQPDADRLLIVSSACHGVEGYCGSGVQVAALHSTSWRQQASQAGVAVVYIHALNPHGFSFDRRVTQEGVDLNRNFHDFSQPLPVNERYRDLHPLLIPTVWPPDPDNVSATTRYIDQHGLGQWQAAISRGQHEFSKGLFYGGTEPTWSNKTLRQVLGQVGVGKRHVAWIDVHTGLGPSGVGEKIFASRDDAQALARARHWWGSDVTSIYDGSSSSPLLTGLMWTAIFDECPQADYTGIALEYGTVPVQQVLQALRADHWMHAQSEVDPELAGQIRQQMRDAFYIRQPHWYVAILEQAQTAMTQALAGLRDV